MYNKSIKTNFEEDKCKDTIIVFGRPTKCSSKQSLFVLLLSHSTCFGCLPHPSSGLHKL